MPCALSSLYVAFFLTSNVSVRTETPQDTCNRYFESHDRPTAEVQHSLFPDTWASSRTRKLVLDFVQDPELVMLSVRPSVSLGSCHLLSPESFTRYSTEQRAPISAPEVCLCHLSADESRRSSSAHRKSLSVTCALSVRLRACLGKPNATLPSPRRPSCAGHPLTIL